MKSRFWPLLIILLLGLTLFNRPEPQTPTPAPISAKQEPLSPSTEPQTYEDLSRWQFATKSAEHFPDFSLWTEAYLAASASDRPALEPRGMALAKHRRRELLTLIQKHPKAALASAVPAAVRAQLPPSILANVEHRISGRGDLEVLARTGAGGAPIIRHAKLGSTSYQAHVFGERLSQRTTQNISLHGIALDGHLALSESPLRVFEPGEQIPADKPVADDSCIVSGQPPRAAAVAAESGDKIYWLCRGGHLAGAEEMIAQSEGPITAHAYAQNGPRRVLLMLVDFPDRPGGPATSAAAQVALDQTATFLAENSYGQISFTSRVITPVLRLPQSSTYYTGRVRGDDNLLTDARAAAVKAGFTPETFDFDMVAFEQIGMGDGSGGVWAGQGYVGHKGAWIQGPLSPGTMVHELGHNIGLWHANLWRSSTIIGAGGTHTEYGNSFDAMGYTFDFPNKHYSANFKYILGWLNSSHVENVLDSATYRIYAHDQNSLIAGRKYAVRIPVGIFVGGEIEDYWLDYRQLLTTRSPNTLAAPILQWGNDSGSQNASRLLDTLPETSTTEDSPLMIGRVFSDPERSLAIETVGCGGAGADAYVDVAISLAAPPMVELAQALDLTDATWTTSATPWTGQRNVTHDAIDAAQSGSIGHSAESWMQTTITGPGALSFWWRVSSEQGFDFLRILRNDVLVASISGEVGWQFRSIEIPAGTHRVRWSYRKDVGASSGADRGWVDQVTFDRSDRPPRITVEPTPFAAVEGEQARFAVEVTGTEPIRFQWRRGEIDLPNQTNIVLTLTNVVLTDAGEYSVVARNDFGSTTSASAQLSVIRPIALSEALDFSAPWTTTGERLWRGQTSVTFDNSDAVRSGPVLDNQRSILQTKITGPGTLMYWRRVSSEANFDWLNVTLDGDIIEQLSGEQDWQRTVVPVPNGTHTLRWTYVKDSAGSAGLDAAWIDLVTFESSDALAPTVVAAPVAQQVAGGMAMFKVDFLGSEPLTYRWLKNGSPIPARAEVAGTDSSLLLIGGTQATDEAAYSLEISNAHGNITTDPANLTFINGLTFSDSLETPMRPWMSGGSQPWTANAEDAKTGAITDLSETWIQTVAQGPARVSFRWKVSSEANFDYLVLLVDGEELAEISGEADWEEKTFDLPAGQHVLKWRYRKDWNTVEGLDAGWLDAVRITPLTQPQIAANLTSGEFVLNLNELQPPGGLVIETSPDLLNWTPARTNFILAPTATISQPTKATGSEFVRVKPN